MSAPRSPSHLVILGAGAIGAGVGGLLWDSGVDVLLVARGAHGRALAERGLDLRLPAGPRRSPAGAMSWRVQRERRFAVMPVRRANSAAVRPLAASAARTILASPDLQR